MADSRNAEQDHGHSDVALVLSWVDEGGKEVLAAGKPLADLQHIAEIAATRHEVAPLRWRRIGGDLMADPFEDDYGYWLIESVRGEGGTDRG